MATALAWGESVDADIDLLASSIWSQSRKILIDEFGVKPSDVGIFEEVVRETVSDLQNQRLAMREMEEGLNKGVQRLNQTKARLSELYGD